MMPPTTLDFSHLLCPLPVIRLQNAIRTLKASQRLQILCTDPGTLHDIPTWCRMYKHTVISIEQTESVICFTIEVNHSATYTSPKNT